MPIPFATSEVVTAAEMNELARAHWRKTTIKTVVNTVAETDLLNGEITIDAGAMSSTRGLRLTAWGDQINNSLATQASPRLKLKLGSTVLIDTGAAAASWANSTFRSGWVVDAFIGNTATNAQQAIFRMWMAGGAWVAVTAGAATGNGVFSSSTVDAHFFADAPATAVDTTAAQALGLTVILPVANAACDMTLRYATVELV